VGVVECGRRRWNRGPIAVISQADLTMTRELVLESFFEALISGDRTEAREIVEKALGECDRPQDLVANLLWPTYEHVERLFRADQLARLPHHTATRLLRVLVDQVASHYKKSPLNGKRMLACCGRKDEDELGAQMAVDLLEASGFTVHFAGGNIPADEIMARAHDARPDILLFFASSPEDLPMIRQVVDTVREIGACPNLQIVVGGGVFNRADGLAEEIGADLWATNPLQLVDALTQQSERRASLDQRTVGRKRRKAA
jgi:MerR family transcriptional regulator, light-induced transcriptional regulator